MAKIAAGAAGDDARIGEVPRAREEGYGSRIDSRPHLLPEHLPEVAEEPEAGDIGGGRGTGVCCGVPGAVVEPCHRFDGSVPDLVLGDPSLDRGGHQAGADRLGEEDGVSVAGTAVAEDPPRVDRAGDRHPVLRLGVVHRVTPDDRHARGVENPPGTGDHPPGQRERQGVARPGDDLEGGQRRARHRIDVGEGVRRRDPPPVLGLVHDRGEEVHGLHDRQVVAEAEHPGVV